MPTSVLLVSLAALAAGCVSLRSAPPRFADAWPPAQSGPRPTVVLVVTGVAAVDGLPLDPGPILDAWGAQSERAYRESALFSDVLVGRGRGDARVEVALRAELSDIPVLSVLSNLTLLVIPHVDTTDIAMTTRVTSAEGQPLGTVEVRGRSRTWYQLLLFPFAGLFEPRTVTPEIVYDLNRQTIATLHARGVF